MLKYLVVALGGSEKRKEKAVSFFDFGLPSSSFKILFTGEPKTNLLAISLKYHIDPTNVISPSIISTDTITDFWCIKDVVDQGKFTDIWIVDSSYHKLRSSIIASQILGTPYNYRFFTVDDPYTWKTMVGEFFSILKNLATLRLRGNKR